MTNIAEELTMDIQGMMGSHLRNPYDLNWLKVEYNKIINSPNIAETVEKLNSLIIKLMVIKIEDSE